MREPDTENSINFHMAKGGFSHLKPILGVFETILSWQVVEFIEQITLFPISSQSKKSSSTLYNEIVILYVSIGLFYNLYIKNLAPCS